MNYHSCQRKTCINYKAGHCSLKDPEINGEFCLEFEETMDFLRLKADPIRGALS